MNRTFQGSRLHSSLVLFLSCLCLVFTAGGMALANESDGTHGFKISPEAFKNFGIQLRKVDFNGVMTLPKQAIFFGLQEQNLYRYRDGVFQRIDFKTLSKTKTEFTVSSEDLQAGDQIAIEGLGFLRVVELAAFGGVSEGHSH